MSSPDGQVSGMVKKGGKLRFRGLIYALHPVDLPGAITENLGAQSLASSSPVRCEGCTPRTTVIGLCQVDGMESKAPSEGSEGKAIPRRKVMRFAD